MSKQIQKYGADDQILSKVLLRGDLSSLNDNEKYAYAMSYAKAVGLNPATMPFQILKLQGKERLYADKGTAELLRASRGLSFGKPEYSQMDGDVLSVTISITDGTRTDYEEGAVYVGGLQGEALANARMKALTKAKRRATLSFCGLGMLDETEVETIARAETTPVPAEPAGRCSEAQIATIRKMYRSHVITDGERESIEARYARGALKGAKTIDWLKEEIENRKEVERTQQANSGEPV
ncbi:hypothetical protein [Prosthecochloris sp.]|uniref:hypothetical protein n=1 Tax=Prosthecochloris sp. TaxID=290513 RepID=UPI0025E95358|nr:hypothetical protein [Prosthecochloris sp.]